ncbi:hypothetical protein L484_002589 [Morus notabilis]|uniref:Uncharacterized protein n=1 Tax=Morus notabilis TaxID=981085 RepID=W9RZF5_9ROSA|nr:hypothetical protein L484_002589 [Morus notabilis]
MLISKFTLLWITAATKIIGVGLFGCCRRSEFRCFHLRVSRSQLPSEHRDKESIATISLLTICRIPEPRVTIGNGGHGQRRHESNIEACSVARRRYESKVEAHRRTVMEKRRRLDRRRWSSPGERDLVGEHMIRPKRKTSPEKTWFGRRIRLMNVNLFGPDLV